MANIIIGLVYATASISYQVQDLGYRQTVLSFLKLFLPRA